MEIETVSTLFTGLFLLGALIGVWVSLNNRIVKTEVRVDIEMQHKDRQFDQIMEHLRRIEDKLDGKADR